MLVDCSSRNRKLRQN